MAVSAEYTIDRKRRWYQDRQAADADKRNHNRLLKSARPAALGLPDDLRAAFLSLGPEGEYDGWASEPLVECSKRGLIARLEECGDDRRAILTGWGRAVLEVLAQGIEAGTATTTQIGVVHESPVAESDAPKGSRSSTSQEGSN